MKQKSLFELKKQPAERVEIILQTDEALIQLSMNNFRMFEIGDRVEIPSIKIKGRIQYIDQKNLFNSHYQPIQVILDESFDGQLMQRTSLKDIKFLEE